MEEWEILSQHFWKEKVLLPKDLADVLRIELKKKWL